MSDTVLESLVGEVGVFGASAPAAASAAFLGAVAELVDSFLTVVAPGAGFFGGGMLDRLVAVVVEAGVRPNVEVRLAVVLVVEGFVPGPRDCLVLVGLAGPVFAAVELVVGLLTEELRLLPGVMVERRSLVEAVELLAAEVVEAREEAVAEVAVGPDMRLETPF